jgi:predicted metal-dependent peptidase
MLGHEPERRSEGKIRICIQRLLDSHPFHASILERFKVAARPDVATMGVTVSGGDVLLFYNCDFVLNTPIEQLTAVLLHEVHHVLFNHIFADRANFPDDWARTIAEEITANEFIPQPLPEQAIRLEQFPHLPPMQSTNERYVQLTGQRDRQRLVPPQDWAPDIGTAGQTSGRSRQAAPPAQQVGPRTDDVTRGRRDAGNCIIDDHGVWQEAQKEPEKAQKAVEDLVREAILDVGTGSVPEPFRASVSAIVGGAQYDLQHNAHGRLDWRARLQHYVGQQLEVQPVFHRPPRRFPELVGIMPGKSYQGRRPKIMAVIDTSGSITTALLEMIGAELGRLAKHYDVKVVECDRIIHAVYDYQRLKCLTGRGGTDFRPPLTKQFLRKHRANLVIYFTDGFGPAPARQPIIPVIWCLVPDGQAPAKWGRVIKM